MTPEWIRRLSVMLIPLLLAAGFATHASHATNVGAWPTMPAVHYVSTGGEDGGGSDSNAFLLISCSALNCNTATTIQGAFVSIEMLPARLRVPITASAMTGHTDPPDPYPPRLRILS